MASLHTLDRNNLNSRFRVLFIYIDYYLEDIKDNPDSSKESIWHLDWEGQWIKFYYKSSDSKRWDTSLFLLKLDILSDAILSDQDN